jgi:enterochelin esterase-like enzyme
MFWKSFFIMNFIFIGAAAWSSPCETLLTQNIIREQKPITDPIKFSLKTGIPGQKVYLASEIFHWDKTAFPMKEILPGEYAIDLPAPWLYQLQYKFLVNGTWLIDPKNPFKTDDGFGGYNSVLNLGFNDDPLLSHTDATPPVDRLTLSLKDLEGIQREVYVVIPHGQGGRPYVAVYFQDGKDYLNRTGVENLLANLSLKENMPIIVGVFIPPKNREQEYGKLDETNTYVNFLADGVVPAIEGKLSFKSKATHRLVIGSSLGGLISLYTALKRNDVFGAVASQSGSFWYPDERIIEILKTAPIHDLKLNITVGQYEGTLEDSKTMLETNQKAIAVAKARGFSVQSQETPTTHDWIAWRNQLGGILKSFYERK